MLQDDESEQYIPKLLLQSDDHPPPPTTYNNNKHNKFSTFSAPPILFDIGTRFYQDFIEQITQNDPQLDKFGLRKTFDKKNEIQIAAQGYRKFSLQNEQYNGYYAVSVPHQHSLLNTMTPQEEILNNLDQAAKWARDQYGSRAVQAVIQNGESYAKNAVFQSLIQEVIELTKDKFGNYVFQKILQRGQQQHKERLFHRIKQRILQFSENCYGCRVVQKAIEFTRFRREQQRQIIQLIKPYCLYLMQSINGNHVMQKVMQIIQWSQLQQVMQIIVLNYRKLSLHAYGCRIIQKYLEKIQSMIINLQLQINHESNTQKAQLLTQSLLQIKLREKEIFQKLITISYELSQCQYGNYVMQHIVAHSKQYQTIIQEIFLLNFMALSSNKYGSNVIEKIIKVSSQEYRQRLAKVAYQSQGLVNLAKHQFGNYVIQCLAGKICIQSRNRLKVKIDECGHQVSKTQYGRHVLLQLQRW